MYPGMSDMKLGCVTGWYCSVLVDVVQRCMIAWAVCVIFFLLFLPSLTSLYVSR